MFRKLEEVDYREIGRRILSRFASRAETQGISVRFAGNVLEYFVRRTMQQDDGARPLRHMLEVEVEDPLATEILHSRGESVETFEVVLEEDGIKIVRVTIDTTDDASDVTHFKC